jgi:two-component system OmpR family sensor kinase/two-component system sensor histidine kinase BaeS
MNRLWVRLSIAFVFVAVISALAVALLATPAAGSQFRQYVARRDLLSQTGILEDLAAYYQANGSWIGVESVLAQSTGRGQGRGRPPLLLADAAGSIVYDERNVRAGTALSAGERDGALPLEVKGATVGFLSLGAPGRGALAANEQDYLDQLQRTLLIAAVVAAGLGIVVGVAISRTVSRPLAQLARAARAFAAHNWEQRVKAGGAEEVAEVAFAFNDMADALQQAETLRRNLMADVAHELRTPLTVLQGNLRAMLDGVYPLERGEIATLYDETRLLNRLVDDLRELALVEAGQLKLNLQPIDLASIIRSTVTNFMPVAEERSIQLDAKIDRAVDVCADPDRVAQVLRNLIANALWHTPPQGHIIVETQSGDRGWRVSVTDTGEGIAPEDLPHVFDRFYRAERSRPRSPTSFRSAQDRGGSGLGLAIARSLVEAMGGQIGVESSLARGSRFWFILPQATARQS